MRNHSTVEPAGMQSSELTRYAPGLPVTICCGIESDESSNSLSRVRFSVTSKFSGQRDHTTFALNISDGSGQSLTRDSIEYTASPVSFDTSSLRLYAFVRFRRPISRPGSTPEGRRLIKPSTTVSRMSSWLRFVRRDRRTNP